MDLQELSDLLTADASQSHITTVEIGIGDSLPGLQGMVCCPWRRFRSNPETARSGPCFSIGSPNDAASVHGIGNSLRDRSDTLLTAWRLARGPLGRSRKLSRYPAFHRRNRWGGGQRDRFDAVSGQPQAVRSGGAGALQLWRQEAPRGGRKYCPKPAADRTPGRAGAADAADRTRSRGTEIHPARDAGAPARCLRAGCCGFSFGARLFSGPSAHRLALRPVFLARLDGRRTLRGRGFLRAERVRQGANSVPEHSRDATRGWRGKHPAAAVLKGLACCIPRW